MGVNSEDRSGGESSDAIKELDKKIETKQKEMDELKKASPVNQAGAGQAQKELEDLKNGTRTRAGRRTQPKRAHKQEQR